MAVKKVAIMLEIDTSEKQESSGTARTDNVPILEARLKAEGADETYLVRITDSHEPGPEGKPNKLAMIDSAAHELGHVLSSVFRMKGGMHEDPRQCAEFLYSSSYADGTARLRDVASNEQAKRIWNNEKLAWELAEKIRPELDQEDKAECLGSYQWAEERAA